MSPLSRNLRLRAQALGLSNAEVARRVGLSERRYGNYVSGKREPDLATLVKIAGILGTSPNSLLSSPTNDETPSLSTILKDRLMMAANRLDDRSLELIVVQIEAVAAVADSRNKEGDERVSSN